MWPSKDIHNPTLEACDYWVTGQTRLGLQWCLGRRSADCNGWMPRCAEAITRILPPACFLFSICILGNCGRLCTPGWEKGKEHNPSLHFVWLSSHSDCQSVSSLWLFASHRKFSVSLKQSLFPPACGGGAISIPVTTQGVEGMEHPLLASQQLQRPNPCSRRGTQTSLQP